MALRAISKTTEASSSYKEDTPTLGDKVQSSSDCCASDLWALPLLLLAKDGIVFDG